jgi:hypothetical protein
MHFLHLRSLSKRASYLSPLQGTSEVRLPRRICESPEYVGPKSTYQRPFKNNFSEIFCAMAYRTKWTCLFPRRLIFGSGPASFLRTFTLGNMLPHDLSSSGKLSGILQCDAGFENSFSLCYKYSIHSQRPWTDRKSQIQVEVEAACCQKGICL